MLHSFPSRDIERLRERHRQRDFQGLCADFDAFVQAPSLPMWRGWLDVFYVYDKQWSDAFFQYHQNTQTNASRSICLLLVHRHIMHVRGTTTERSCAAQEQLMRDMTLATHGLVQPLVQDTHYKCVGFVLEALLHVVDAKSLDAQWRMHVVPQLSPAWRLVFLWGQLVIVMAHGDGKEAVDEALSDCDSAEKSLLEPLAQAYLSTDEQLAAGEDVVRFSNDPLCGDVFAIDMADYYFEQGDETTALAWIEEKMPHVYDILNSNEWLDGARELVQGHAPQSALLTQLTNAGVQRRLPGALHAKAMESLDEDFLLENAQHGNTDSMVVLAQILEEQGRDTEGLPWLLKAANVFHSEALYLLARMESPQKLEYLTQAAQRLHGDTLFDVAVGVLDGKLQWRNHEVLAQQEGADFDPGQAIELLEKARDAGVGEAATLLFDVLSSHVDESTFFALCYTAAQADSDYVQHGYDKALALGHAERIFEWAQLLLEAKGNQEDVLFELGSAAHWLGRTQVATKSWTQAANMGHGPSAKKIDDFKAGLLAATIVPKDKGWQRTWSSLAKKFKRA